MKRIFLDYLQDMLNSIQEIESFINGRNYEEFNENKMLKNAVIRSLEVLGEASKNIPEELKMKYSEIPWKRISGMRDKLIHNYFGVDYRMVWEVSKSKIPEIKPLVENLMKKESENLK